MSKPTNKLISLALALVMLCALAVSAFAAAPDYVAPTGKWYGGGSYGGSNILP